MYMYTLHAVLRVHNGVRYGRKASMQSWVGLFGMGYNVYCHCSDNRHVGYVVYNSKKNIAESSPFCTGLVLSSWYA